MTLLLLLVVVSSTTVALSSTTDVVFLYLWIRFGGIYGDGPVNFLRKLDCEQSRVRSPGSPVIIASSSSAIIVWLLLGCKTHDWFDEELQTTRKVSGRN